MILFGFHAVTARLSRDPLSVSRVFPYVYESREQFYDA